MCTAGQRVLLTITGPGPSFFKVLILCIFLIIIPVIIQRLNATITQKEMKDMNASVSADGLEKNAKVSSQRYDMTSKVALKR